MTVYLAKLNKAALTDIPAGERSLFLSLAHLANEIRTFQKLYLWTLNSTAQNDAETSGQMALSLIFVKLLAGKLNEGHKLLQTRYFGAEGSREYQRALPEEAKQALAQIKRYFNRKNTIRHIRDNYAFHYSPDEIDAALPNLPDKLDLYIQEDGSANTLYYFAEVLANRALLKSVAAQDDQDALRLLMEDIAKVAHWFTVACDCLLTEFIRRNAGTIWEGNAVKVIFKNELPFHGVRIPWFTDTSALKPGRHNPSLHRTRLRRG